MELFGLFNKLIISYIIRRSILDGITSINDKLLPNVEFIWVFFKSKRYSIEIAWEITYLSFNCMCIFNKKLILVYIIILRQNKWWQVILNFGRKKRRLQHYIYYLISKLKTFKLFVITINDLFFTKKILKLVLLLFTKVIKFLGSSFILGCVNRYNNSNVKIITFSDFLVQYIISRKQKCKILSRCLNIKNPMNKMKRLSKFPKAKWVGYFVIN